MVNFLSHVKQRDPFFSCDGRTRKRKSDMIKDGKSASRLNGRNSGFVKDDFRP